MGRATWSKPRTRPGCCARAREAPAAAMPFAATFATTFFTNRRRDAGLDIHNLQRLSEALDGIAAGREPIFVGDITGESEVGDRLRDEAVVDLLRFIDLVAAGNAARMEV